MSNASSHTAAAQTFAGHVAAAQGRHPIELFTELAARTDPLARKLCREAADEGSTFVATPQGDGLALPHPLDAEWRFTDRAADDLLGRAVAATRDGDAILLLGVPTVVLAARRSGADRRFVVVSDANTIGAQLATLVAEDTRFPTASQHVCASAIVDPPWYPAIFASLVAQAAARCDVGATVFVGAPSVGVRPTCPEERDQTLGAALAAGLTHLATEAEALVYRTPAFEAAAMRAAGLNVAMPVWRRGDLLVLRKDRNGETPSLPPSTPAFELTLQGVRLRLLAQPVTDAASLMPLVPGEVFPSVSARAPGRARANLWTSGNRAFVCPPLMALAALHTLACQHDLWPKGLDPSGTGLATARRIDPIHLVNDLARIAARDLAHMQALVGGSSWDQATNDARFLNGSATTFLRTLLGGPSSQLC